MEKHKHIWIDIYNDGSWFRCSICDAKTNSPAGMDWLEKQLEKWENAHPAPAEPEGEKDAENKANLQP